VVEERGRVTLVSTDRINSQEPSTTNKVRSEPKLADALRTFSVRFWQQRGQPSRTLCSILPARS